MVKCEQLLGGKFDVLDIWGRIQISHSVSLVLFRKEQTSKPQKLRGLTLERSE